MDTRKFVEVLKKLASKQKVLVLPRDLETAGFSVSQAQAKSTNVSLVRDLVLDLRTPEERLIREGQLNETTFKTDLQQLIWLEKPRTVVDRSMSWKNKKLHNPSIHPLSFWGPHLLMVSKRDKHDGTLNQSLVACAYECDEPFKQVWEVEVGENNGKATTKSVCLVDDQQKVVFIANNYKEENSYWVEVIRLEFDSEQTSIQKPPTVSATYTHQNLEVRSIVDSQQSFLILMAKTSFVMLDKNTLAVGEGQSEVNYAAEFKMDSCIFVN